MKEGQGKEQATIRLHLPLFPGKDDVFAEMSLLFIDAFDEMVRMIGGCFR